MLRTTGKADIYFTIGCSRLGGGVVPNNSAILEKIIVNVKERTKRTSYYAGFLMRNPDRELMYAHSGGPKQGRFWIKRRSAKNQHFHWHTTWEKYTVTPVNTHPWQLLGGIHRCIWDHTSSSSNVLNDTGFKVTMRNCDKTSAVRHMDMWGLKYTILDERSSPKMIDFSYVRHRLYSQNFPWKKDPVLGPSVGDADYDWKGVEKLDYSKYGATIKSERNSFQSLWDQVKQEAKDAAAKRKQLV